MALLFIRRCLSVRAREPQVERGIVLLTWRKAGTHAEIVVGAPSKDSSALQGTSAQAWHGMALFCCLV
jgi:hypothetical protein